MSIAEILTQDNWQALIAARYPGCDLAWWATRRASMLTAAPRRPRRSAARRNSRRVNYAELVVKREVMA